MRTLIILLLATSFLFAQRRPGSGYSNSYNRVQSRQLLADSLDNSLNIVKYYADTTAMKAETGANVKQAYVEAFGNYILKTSSETTDGFNFFSSTYSGKQWVFSSGKTKVDNVTLETFGNDSTRVKDLGITTAKIAASAVTSAKLAGSISDSKLNQITTADKVAGSAVELNVGGSISNSSGLLLADNAVTAAKVQNSTLIWVDLSQALKDSIAGNGTKNITYNFFDTAHDTTVTYSADLDTLQIDISGWSYTTPKVTNLVFYDTFWGVTIKSVSANYLVLKTAYAGFGTQVKATIGVNEQ